MSKSICFSPLKNSWARFLLLAVLAFGAVAVPVRVRAQEPASAVETQPPAESSAAAKPEAKKETKSEEEEANEYRHSATVKWFANLLHIDVETAAKTFEFINFGVVFLLIAIPLIRILPKVMRQRSAKLSFDLEVAQAKTMDANERLKAVEARLAGLDGEIAAFRKQVEEDMKSDEARMKASIEEESARIVKAAEQEIAVAGALAERSLKQFAADLAIDRALSQLTLSPETDRALIAEFAGELASLPGGKSRKGGQN